MVAIAELLDQRWKVGAICAIGAVALGLAYLTLAGAPTRYMLVNAAALAIGFLLFGLASPLAQADNRTRAVVTLALALLLLLATLFGRSVEGATRWFQIGGLTIQPSLILLPLLAVNFARSHGPLATVGVGIAAVALAIQPDRAMAAALAAAMLALVFRQQDRRPLVALAISLAALAVTMARPDTQGAVPFVDQIFYTAFLVGPLAGLAVVTGAVLLPLPGLLRQSGQAPGASAAFAAVWAAIVIAALIGNYPTPLVGYGGSAIIGYMLTLAAFPRRADGDQLSNRRANA